MTEFVFHNSRELNHFLKAPESKRPFSHKIVVPIMHEQNVICTCHVMGSTNEKEKNTLNDNVRWRTLYLTS